MKRDSETTSLVEERFSFDKEAYKRLGELQQILRVSDKAAVIREALIRLDTKVFCHKKQLSRTLSQKTEASDDRPAELESSGRTCVSFDFDEQAHRRMVQLKERIKVSTFAEVVRRALLLLDNQLNAQR